MRYLGIDYGSRRIGTALSDESGTLAFPHEVFANDKKAEVALSALCKKENVGAIVMGESRDLSGRENTIAVRTRAFADVLAQATGLPVYPQEEYWSSEEATRFHGKNDKIDASAAAIILQRFLDKQNSSA